MQTPAGVRLCTSIVTQALVVCGHLGEGGGDSGNGGGGGGEEKGSKRWGPGLGVPGGFVAGAGESCQTVGGAGCQVQIAWGWWQLGGQVESGWAAGRWLLQFRGHSSRGVDT